MVNLSENITNKIDELINKAEASFDTEKLDKIFIQFRELIDAHKEQAYEISKFIPVCMNPEREDGLKYSGGRPEIRLMNCLMTHAAQYDDRVINDYLSFHEQHKMPVIQYWDYSSGSPIGNELEVKSLNFIDSAMKEGKIPAKRWFELLKQTSSFTRDENYTQYLTTDIKPASKLMHGDVRDSWEAKYESYLQKYMINCVERDPSLLKNFLCHVNTCKRMNCFVDSLTATVDVSNAIAKHQKKLPVKTCEDILYIAEDLFYDDQRRMLPALKKVMHQNPEYILSFSKIINRINDKEDIKYIADVYEKLANKELKLEDTAESLPSEMRLSEPEEKLKDACKKLINNVKDTDTLKVKLSAQYPLLSQDIESDNPHVNMCINNLENPQKENIRSILNRLKETEAKDYSDFTAAVDFVHRRDMCRKVCKDFAQETERYVDDGQLSYGMAQAGIDNPQTAKVVAELFYKLNDRPQTYGSSYNHFYPDALVKIADAQLEDWMLPILEKAVEDGMMRADNMGNSVDLFAACKAWKICPKMPKAVAEQVGEMSLAKRMIAGAVTEKLAPEQYSRLNHRKELIPEFWKEMSRAQELPFAEAMKMYIPDTKINRKRFTAAMLEEMGVENSAEKYKTSYRKLEESGKFEEFLAPRGENKTIVRVEQMVKLAKIKQNKETVQRISKVSSARGRLVEKGLLPKKGKFGDGHNIITPSRDMTAFQEFVSER